MPVIANIFQPLIDIFEPALKFFHSTVGVGWGLSIMLLTVVIRALLLPLAVKQFHSMQKLQRLTPELKAIQNKYKEDKQRQQQELMKLYREHGVNPASSCLPLAAQIPVFIGLFYTLRTSLRKDICPHIQSVYQQAYSLKHHISLHAATAHTTACGARGGAGFLFINDLTNKATGATLVVLILLYVGTQLASSLLMSTPTMDRTQRQMTILLPLFFVIFIIQFPAGLIVYWITTNAWTMLQQYVIRRRIGTVAPVTAGAPGGAGGGPPGGPDGREPEGPAGALGGLLRGRGKDEEKEPAGVGASRSSRATAPPPPPRKKKKRSGRRR